MCAAKNIRGENIRDFMRFPGLIRELEALETGFRMDMDINQRRAKIPWIMEGRSGLRQEEDPQKKQGLGNFPEALLTTASKNRFRQPAVSVRVASESSPIRQRRNIALRQP